MNLCNFCGQLEKTNFKTCRNCHNILLPLKNIYPTNECCVCMEDKTEQAYFTCGHVICLHCSTKVTNCPYRCESELISIKKVGFKNSMATEFCQPIMALKIGTHETRLAYAQWLKATMELMVTKQMIISTLPEPLFQIWQHHCASNYNLFIIYTSDKLGYYQRFYTVYSQYLKLFPTTERLVTDPHPHMNSYLREEFAIYCKDDRSRRIPVYNNMSILKLTLMVKDIFEFSDIKSFCLRHRGRSLSDMTRTIGDVGIQVDDNILLIPLLRGD